MSDRNAEPTNVTGSRGWRLADCRTQQMVNSGTCRDAVWPSHCRQRLLGNRRGQEPKPMTTVRRSTPTERMVCMVSIDRRYQRSNRSGRISDLTIGLAIVCCVAWQYWRKGYTVWLVLNSSAPHLLWWISGGTPQARLACASDLNWLPEARNLIRVTTSAGTRTRDVTCLSLARRSFQWAPQFPIWVQLLN